MNYNKKAQDKKLKIPSLYSKKAQEEMVGFALIIIIVAVIIIVFISLTLTRPQTEVVESYEVNSFLQVLLQHTTDCEDNLEYLSLQKLIFRCDSGGRCLDDRDTCDVLNDTLEEIISQTWQKEQGYELIITSEQEIIYELSYGNVTNTYKGAVQPFSRGGEAMQVSFKVYY
jgi:hypothetical protein